MISGGTAHPSSVFTSPLAQGSFAGSSAARDEVPPRRRTMATRQMARNDLGLNVMAHLPIQSRDDPAWPYVNRRQRRSNGPIRKRRSHKVQKVTWTQAINRASQ